VPNPNDVINDILSELESRLDALLTFGGTSKEANIVYEFQDKSEVYPCVILEAHNGSSDSRYVGTNEKQLLTIPIEIMCERADDSSDITACSDSVSRSERKLVNYLCEKIFLNLKLWNPTSIATIGRIGVDKENNLDFEERDGVYKGRVTVVMEF